MSTVPPTNNALEVVARLANDVSVGKENRDTAIRWARLSGASFREIADAAHMTTQGIRKIVAKKVDN